MEHLTFVCELYKDQIDGERFFMHEHHAQARSWGLWMICEILEKPGVVRIVGEHCPLRAVLHRRGGTIFGSQAHAMDDNLVEGGQSAAPQVLWRAPALQPLLWWCARDAYH